MLKYGLLIPLLLISCGCDSPIDTSEKTLDAPTALRIVAITTQPPPKVVFAKYQNGLDDNMRLVIRIPKSQLPAFWESSPWNNESEREEIFPNKPGSTGLYRPDLPAGTEPEWAAWQKSNHGIQSYAELPNVKFARIFVALDQDEEDAIAYIFWHEV
jgi:hypothetical protein